MTTVIGDTGDGPAGPAGAVLSTRARRAPSIAGLRGEVEAQAERWFLWTPVAAGCGAAAYFGLRSEPRPSVVLAAVLVFLASALAASWSGRSRGLVVVATLAAFAATGFGWSSLRTRMVAAPVAPAGLEAVLVEGWVVDVESASAERPRLLIAPTWIRGLSPEATPVRIRVTLRDRGLIGPGQAIRVRALVNPPPPPAAPGAYDFARDAWFTRVGGSGLALTPPLIVSLEQPSTGLRASMAVNAARWSLARRLVERMGEETGGMAAALVTGHQAWLSEDDIEAMRASGLAHILSISGVHMAIVGGFVFAGLRLLIAAWPWLALRAPGKKIAATGALVAVLVYLAVSGAPPPAERAAVTAGAAFAAMLFDRRALSLHSLALAALVVLALQPEAVTQPGFQMSFAATAALLAMAELWPRPTREINAPWPIVAVQRLQNWIAVAFMISFVAGLATTPFAIQHFNRVTVWGLPANLTSEALSTLVVLPMLAIGATLELLGMGAGPLTLAHWGLQATTAIAHYFAALPGSELIVASAPAWALPVSFIGLLWVCLWRGRLRWAGLPFAAAVVLAPRPPAPDVWIADDGANAAVRLGGEAVVMRPEAQAFASELWSRRRGLALPADPPVAAAAAFDCGRDACRPLAAAPVQVALWRRRIPPTAEALAGLCAAEVVVLRTGSGRCSRATVIDQAALARGGAAELFRTRDGWRVVWAQDLRGDRPWSRPSATPAPELAR